MSMITATAWVPRGYPAQFPTKYTVDDKELDRISKLAKLKLEDAKEDLQSAEREEEVEEEDDDAMNENGRVKVPEKKAYAVCNTSSSKAYIEPETPTMIYENTI